MPIRESWCENKSCSGFHKELEHYYHRMDQPLNDCEACGQQTALLISSFAAIWTGNLGKYIDNSCEMTHQRKDGHWAMRRNSSRMADGSPEPVFISTRQDQREFCKAEGLEDPFGLNPNIEGNADGMYSSSRLRSSWV